jgi:hypothetical protein
MGRLMAVTLAVQCLPLLGADVPLVLPDPDGKPGDAKNPVKVYILAGQSNMLGFGQLETAAPYYKSVFLTADPNVIPQDIRIGKGDRHTVISHGVHQAATGDARGGRAAVYRGAYDPVAGYDAMKPIKEEVVALGTVSATLPSAEEPHTVVAKAFVDVPTKGRYRVHVGYKESSYAVATVAGKEVYRKDIGGEAVITEIDLEAFKRYPITITYMKSGSATLWMERVGLKGKGDLTTVVNKEGKFPWMVDEKGKWTVRQDVTYSEARCNAEGKWNQLSATSNGDKIGPEVAFGYVMGTFHDEQVLLIESSMGNRGLWWDFRPPSSGRLAPDSEWEGKEWALMIQGVRLVLDKIDQVVPNYKGQGYEIAGFVWFQGHKDYITSQPKEKYERNLVNLINDLRREFKVPAMKAVVATIGFGGYNMGERETAIWKAQMAVGDPKQHPELAKTVASVDTRGYWRDAWESPKSAGYHYNHNAETYMLVGDAMGRAMVKLMGGEVEMPPQAEPPAARAEAPEPEPTEAQKAAAARAMEPMIVDGMLADHLANPRTVASLQALANGEKPRRASPFLPDGIDAVVTYYEAIGNQDYSWHDFGPDMKNGEWAYFSFDPPEEKDKAEGGRYREVTYPDGMDNWFAKDFDAKKAGWKTGESPFGQKNGKREPLSDCQLNMCRCGVPPKTLWEKEVILIRQAFKIPPLKEGHRYRLVVGGSAHVHAGDGYDLYADGKLLAQSKSGVGKRQGHKPRGGHIYADLKPEFADGEVTIALRTFLRYNHPRIKPYPPRGHLSVWMEEQKLPPIPEAKKPVATSE